MLKNFKFSTGRIKIEKAGEIKCNNIFYLTLYIKNIIISMGNQYKNYHWDILHLFFVLSFWNSVCKFYIYSTSRFTLVTF